MTHLGLTLGLNNLGHLAALGGALGGGGVSGAVEGEEGSQYGFTDFSEFTVGTGLPTGITFYGNSADVNSGSELGIANDATEGNYFYWDALTDFQARCYGIDAFDAVGFSTGEILARIYCPALTATNSRYDTGPACWIENPTNNDAGRNWLVAGNFKRNVSTDHEIGVQSLDGTTASLKSSLTDIADGEETDVWAWIRMRIDSNASNFDYKAKMWYGSIGNEPGAWESTATNVSGLGATTGALGLAQPASQRDIINQCAYFSFSEVPDTTPPPTP